MSDVWEEQYAAQGLLPDEDFDGDGVSNLDESLQGTNPYGSGSHPPYTAPSTTATDVTFHSATVPGILYQPEISEDLLLWDELGSPVVGDGNVLEDTVTMGVGDTQLFYRLRSIIPRADADLDGLDTYEEALVGTVDSDSDFDDDGLEDGFEVGQGYSPTSSDSDGDGIPDGAEYAAGGDPLDASDGLGPVGVQRNILTRLLYRGTWPTPLTTSVPTLSVKIGTPPSPTGHEITQAHVNTAGAASGSPMVPVNNTSIIDKEITAGVEYPFTMDWAGTGSWANVWGRAQAGPFPAAPTAYQPANLLFYTGAGVSTATPKGWFISNESGAVFREVDWATTGFPPSSNLVNYPLDGRDYKTGKLFAVVFDLDIDSDNTVGPDALPQRTLAEDDFEADQPKIVPLNNNDDDADAFADNEELEVSGERDLVPMVLEVTPQTLPWEKVKIKFKYPGDAAYATVATEPLRLWRVNSAGQTRTSADYIIPDHEYLAGDLGLGTGAGKDTRIKVFVEGAVTTDDPVDIEVLFLFTGDTHTREYFKDKLKVQVAGVKFAKTLDLAGYDEQSRPNWIMVPQGAANEAELTIEPSTLVGSITVENSNTGVATVNPTSPTSDSTILTIEGLVKGDAMLSGRSGTTDLAKLGVAVKDRREVTLTIHGVTQRDGTGAAGQVAIEAGVNGTIDSVPGGDDEIVPAGPPFFSGPYVSTGPDGVCNTTRLGDDTLLLRPGLIPPVHVPDATTLQTYLNNVYGSQANVYFTVTRSDITIDYDSDKNSKLYVERTFTAFEMSKLVTAVAATPGYHVFYVADFDYTPQPDAIGIALLPGRFCVVEDRAFDSDYLLTTAHELGHCFGLQHTNEPSDSYIPGLSVPQQQHRLMYPNVNGSLDYLLVHPEWTIIGE